MSATREDMVWIEGWHSGVSSAIQSVRQEILALEHEEKVPVSLEIYEILNFLDRENEEARRPKGE